MNEKIPNMQSSSYRWIVLLLFMIVALLSQVLWLTFAPISSEIAELFHVTTFDISFLSLVWPIVFVITAIPVGIYIDKKGFKRSVSVGAVFIAVFSVIRIFSTTNGYNFTLLLLSQICAAVSQPFIFGSITKLAVSWFSEKEQGLATGLGTIGLFLGMMLALVLTPFLYITYGITNMLVILAIISCVGAFLFLIFAREGKVVDSKEASSAFTIKDIWTLSKKRDFIILEYGFFVCVGGFTAILTWLEVMLNSLHGIGIDQAGIAGGLMILGGIIGSIIIPALSDKLKKIKVFVLVDLAIGTIAFYFIGIFKEFLLVAVICYIVGFFLMSALPLVLQISNRITGLGMEGRASSLLWFFSQVGSILLIAIIEPVQLIWGSYFSSIIVIVILWALAFLLFTIIREVKVV
ncbi:Major Facilitator Superfamily protein [uncultured archaeon]|nr:Major Facilitator Superfamily protein [uncultured archaeon]